MLVTTPSRKDGGKHLVVGDVAVEVDTKIGRVTGPQPSRTMSMRRPRAGPDKRVGVTERVDPGLLAPRRTRCSSVPPSPGPGPPAGSSRLDHALGHGPGQDAGHDATHRLVGDGRPAHPAPTRSGSQHPGHRRRPVELEVAGEQALVDRPLGGRSATMPPRRLVGEARFSMRSSRIRSGRSARNLSSASRPSAAETTRNPRLERIDERLAERGLVIDDEDRACHPRQDSRPC